MFEEHAIDSFTSVITGGTPSTSKDEYWNNGNIPWLNSGELQQDIITKSSNFITDLGLKNSSSKLMPKDSILIALTGTTTGKVGYLTFEACANQSVTGILPSSKHIPKYLYYYLNSIRSKVMSDAYGGAQPHISQAYVKKIKIPLPPLNTQKHIVQILDDAATLRDKTKKLIKEYDTLAQSIFLDMFGDPVRNTKKIKQITIDEITNVSSGSTPSRENESYYNGNIPWVKTGEVNGRVILNTEENLSEEGLKNSSCKVYPKGSLIIAMYGQGKTRGQVGILGVPASTNQACAVLSPSEKMNFTFLYEHLKLCYEDLRRLGRGGNQPNLNAGLIKSYSVLFPPIDLQNQFAEKIALIEQQKEFAKQELKESEDLFNCLLQKAFKGELV